MKFYSQDNGYENAGNKLNFFSKQTPPTLVLDFMVYKQIKPIPLPDASVMLRT